jgi:hypothetical protein
LKRVAFYPTIAQTDQHKESRRPQHVMQDPTCLGRLECGPSGLLYDPLNARFRAVERDATGIS